MHWTQNNSGAAFFGVVAGANLSITAGAGQDGQQQTGPIIDRMATGRPWARSGKIMQPFLTTLASGQSLAFAVVLEHGNEPTMSDATTFVSANLTVQTAPTGPVVAANGVGAVNVDLMGAKRYLRVKYTPNLSASGTDTAVLGQSIFALGGLEHIPVPSGM
jgi:hypothetical protein